MGNNWKHGCHIMLYMLVVTCKSGFQVCVCVCAGTSCFSSCIVIKSCSGRKWFDVDLVGAFHPQ